MSTTTEKLIFLKGGNLETDTCREIAHEDEGREPEEVFLQAKGWQRSSAKHQKLGERPERFLESHNNSSCLQGLNE